jgi:hypothetical protein
MDYEVVLSRKAERTLSALDPTLRVKVAARLFELGKWPTQLSRPVVSPPHPPGGMVYEFSLDLMGSTLHHFAIFFLYGQNEVELIVSAIGHTALLIDDAD